MWEDAAVKASFAKLKIFFKNLRIVIFAISIAEKKNQKLHLMKVMYTENIVIRRKLNDALWLCCFVFCNGWYCRFHKLILIQ